MKHTSNITRTHAGARVLESMIFAIVFWAASASPAMCEEYLPLSVGFEWEYEGLEGHHEVQRVEGIINIWGADVYAMRYEGNPLNEGLVNYWTCDEAGSVLLWGFYIIPDSFGILYDPPIRMVDAPLELGKTWSCTVNVFEWSDSTSSTSLTLDFTVEEEGLIVVPAGEFYTFGIGYEFPPKHLVPLLQDRDIFGTPLGGHERPPASDWWTDGIGRIQYVGAYLELFQLAPFSGPTPCRKGTWGSIKTPLHNKH
ncbi:MAG: hypothetical protein KJ831_10555 [Candidatus Eisenbacteria bacterium]|nr:hypothetical protein [Candidatus Eisenbacteria bacterium]